MAYHQSHGVLAKTSFVNVSTADPMVCQPAAGDALLITNSLAGRVGKQEQLSQDQLRGGTPHFYDVV